MTMPKSSKCKEIRQVLDVGYKQIPNNLKLAQSASKAVVKIPQMTGTISQVRLAPTSGRLGLSSQRIAMALRTRAKRGAPDAPVPGRS